MIAVTILAAAALLLALLSIGLAQLDKQMYREVLQHVAQQRDIWRALAKNHTENKS